MNRFVFVLLAAAVLAVPAATGNSLYGVLDCADRVTIVDSVFLKQLGRQEIPVYTPGFRGDPGEVDTFDFGSRRWPDEYIRVTYLYGLARMPSVTFRSPEQNTWYELPEPALAASRVKFYIGAGVEEWLRSPAGVRPVGASPNPFAARTTVRFGLAAEGPVRVRLFDRDGRAVRTLADRRFPAGEHALAWDRRDDGGALVQAGVYLLRVETGAGAGSVKLVARD
ncbi:MAG TPA: T9SS type A sorting domain-containing protein [candidate division WOR-3 bacterium]|uniref:T9SS type A sorting domain-containing protein n=1 Tax=candidate division WOR-3 bacterium TaxID=2052148 RepID=A0A7V0T4L6_UNCW3|nr:T9SS type A sorting domain-containing protein [candidate division WOR-3 bacterium]